MGTVVAFCMNGLLNIYYLCTLRYSTKEKKFRCYVEVPFYIVINALCIAGSYSFLLNQELLNPGVMYPLCLPTNYPPGCTKDDNPDCRGGELGEGEEHQNDTTLVVIGLAFFSILIITMALIVHSFYRNERKLLTAVKDDLIQENDDAYNELRHAQETSGIITRQALMYIVAFLITWAFAFIEFLWLKYANDPGDALIAGLAALRLLFQSLQGLFNLIIFVYHKVCMILRSDEDMTVAEALDIVFLHPDIMEDLVLVQNLDFVFEDSEQLPQINKGIDRFRSGFEDVESEPGHGIQFDSVNASMADSSVFVRNEGPSDIAEEQRDNKYKYYSGQKVAVPPGLYSINKLSPRANEIKDSRDGALPLMLKKEATTGNGISFAPSAVKRPSAKMTNETFDDDNSTNLSYSEARSVFSKLSAFSMLSGFSSPSETDNL